MRVNIIDPGCVSASSHHHPINLGLLAFCEARAIEVRLLVNKKADPTIASTPNTETVFTNGIVYNRPEDELFMFYEMYSHAAEFARELSDATKSSLGLGDTFVLHTVTASQLLGLSIWLKSIPIRDMHIKVVLRFPAEFRLEGPRAKLNVAFYKYVFDVLEKNARDRVAIFADSDALTESFQKRYAVPVASSPLPIEYFHEPIKKQSAKGNCITFVYAGESRNEKGFHLLGEAFEKTLTTYPDVSFRIQATDFDASKLGWPKVVLQRTEIITGNLGQPDFQAFLLTGDVVLVPYDPHEYTYRTSHIFAEAVGLGLPVITSASSWMANEFKKFNLAPGVLMSDFTVPALTESMLTVINDLDAFTLSAQAGADAWRARQNFQSFARTVLGIE